MSAHTVSLAGARILVTGGTGFVGSAFVRRAVQDRADVIVAARPSADHWRLTPVAGRYQVVPVSLSTLDRIVPNPATPIQVMVHFAAAGVNPQFDDLHELIETNVMGTIRALECARRLAVARFVFIGSSGEYGPGERISEDQALRPTSEYGASRAGAALLARAFGAHHGLDVVVVRPFAVYGPFEAPYRLVPYCILRGLHGETLQISSGVQSRDYVHVADVADGIARACVLKEAGGDTFNLCTGISTSVLDAARSIAELTGARSRVEPGARAAIPGEMWKTSGDPTRARERLGWIPERNLLDGLRHTIDWFRQEGLTHPAYQQRPSTITADATQRSSAPGSAG